MNYPDDETFAGFAERFALIERQIPDPPQLRAPAVVGLGRAVRSLSPAFAAIIVAILLAAVATLAGIGSHPTPAAPSPTAPRTALSYPLPTYDSRINVCAGVGVGSLILHGRITNGAAEVWANNATPILWPPGYVARFEPNLVVVDGSGLVRGREGEEMLSVPPWHGQLVCPYSRGNEGGLAVDVFPLPTPATLSPASSPGASISPARGRVDVINGPRPVIVSIATDRGAWLWLVPAGGHLTLLDEPEARPGGIEVMEAPGPLTCKLLASAFFDATPFTIVLDGPVSDGTYTMRLQLGASFTGPANTDYFQGCTG